MKRLTSSLTFLALIVLLSLGLSPRSPVSQASIPLDQWQRHVVDSDKPWRALFVDGADLNGDNWPDIVTGGWWYENPKSPTGDWARHAIGSPLNNMAAVHDWDGDGDPDVLGTEGQGSDSSANFYWARNNGSGSFTILNNVQSGDGDFLQGVAVERFGDAGLQVALSWHVAGKGVQRLTVPGDPSNETWVRDEISGISQDEDLSVGDIDQDGDVDLLLGTKWLRNSGASWTEHTLNPTGGDPDRNELADIDRDGKLDAVVGFEAVSQPGKLAWYRQGNDSTGTWAETVIATVIGPMSLDVADMDGDGDQDVVVGEHSTADSASCNLYVFENADGYGSSWVEHLVYSGDEHHDGAQIVDIDRDGDLDIISIGWTHGRVLWYENTAETPTPTPRPPDTPPDWTHLSSRNGDLPAPGTATQQTASLILDVDRDGVNDFVIASRRSGQSLVWYKRSGDGWTKYLIEGNTLEIEAGGAYADIDGDGDLDVVMGGDNRSNQVWWWENPYPNYGQNTPWTRRVIKDGGSNKHHDQIFGDFDGDGRQELVFWNQTAQSLYLAEIPADPRNTQPWPYTRIYGWSSGAEHEGLAKADIDGDGQVDIVGGGRWFKHNGGTSYTPEVIDSSQTFGRVAAGQLKVGGRAEVVFVPGDTTGSLEWYEWVGGQWVGHTLVDNVDHGHSLQVVDVGGDGNLDIFCAEMRLHEANPDAKIWVFYGDSNGGFRESVVATGYGNHESRVADLDGDGDVDILGKPYDWDTPRVDVWLNGGSVPVTATPTATGEVVTPTTTSTATPTATDTPVTGQALYAEDFEGYGSGANPDGWYDTGANNSMGEEDSMFAVYDVSGNQAFGTTSTASNIHSHYVGGGSQAWSDYRYTGRMRMTASTSGIGLTFYSDYASTDSYYRLRRYGDTDFHLAPHPDRSISLSGDTETGVVAQPNVWYWFTVEVENQEDRTEIRAKVWPEGSVEPAGWQVDAWHSGGGRFTAGRIGLWSYTSGAKYWDDLSVQPLP